MKSKMFAMVLFLPFSLQAREPYRQEIVVKPLLKTQTDGTGTRLVYPANGQAEVTGFAVKAANPAKVEAAKPAK